MVEISATVDRYVFPNCKTTGVKMNPLHLTKTLHENVLPLVLFFYLLCIELYFINILKCVLMKDILVHIFMQETFPVW